MKTLTLEHLEWIVEALPEDAPIEGNVLASGDDAADRRAERSVRRQLEAGNQWAWCVARVAGQWKGLRASDYLGGCSYKGEKDFIKNSGYYDDMRATVLAEIQKQAASIVEALV
jgi:hypothetical protein